MESLENWGSIGAVFMLKNCPYFYEGLNNFNHLKSTTKWNFWCREWEGVEIIVKSDTLIFWGTLGAVWGSWNIKLVNLVFELSGHPVAINVVCDLDRTMAQLITYVSYVMAAQQPDRGVCMPQVVYPNPLQACLPKAFI